MFSLAFTPFCVMPEPNWHDILYLLQQAVFLVLFAQRLTAALPVQLKAQEILDLGLKNT